jgi:hypothetical protein
MVSLLYRITAPVLSRFVREASPMRFRTYQSRGYDRVFAPSFGDATPTEQLKTGAGQFKRLATPLARRVLRPTDQGGASSPHRSFAVSPKHPADAIFP